MNGRRHNIVFLLWNTESVCRKFDHLKSLIHNSNKLVDIIVIIESWLHKDYAPTLSGYNKFLKNRTRTLM